MYTTALILLAFVVYLASEAPYVATASSATTQPPPSGPPTLAIRYYINMNYTAILGNYTIESAIQTWQTRWDPQQFNFSAVFNKSLYAVLPWKTVNLTAVGPGIGWIFANQSGVMQFSVGRVISALIGTWGTTDAALSNYYGLLDSTLNDVTTAWAKRQFAFAADYIFSDVNTSMIKSSDLLIGQNIAVDPNVTMWLTNSTPDGMVSAAGTVVGLAATRLSQTTTWNTYLGVIATALQTIAKNQGYTSGYNYSSFLANALQGVSQWWPGKKGDLIGLWANFSTVSLNIDWQGQLGGGVNWIDPTIALPLNVTKFEFYSRPPVTVPLVTVIDIEFYVTGKMSPDDLLARIRWLNSQLILIFTIGKYIVQLWLIEDNMVPDHSQIPQLACIASFLSFFVAFGTLGYFMRKLHKSERYQQVPILDEDEEEIS